MPPLPSATGTEPWVEPESTDTSLRAQVLRAVHQMPRECVLWEARAPVLRALHQMPRDCLLWEALWVVATAWREVYGPRS